LVYAKYFRRNGRVFGPYYYKSIRDGTGRVRNIYVGRELPKEGNAGSQEPSLHGRPGQMPNAKPEESRMLRTKPGQQMAWSKGRIRFYASIIFLAIVLSASLLARPAPTGMIAASLQTHSYSPGEALSGFVSMDFGSQDLIPEDSEVAVSIGNESRSMGMDRFMSLSGSTVGKGAGLFYESGSAIGGSGMGYGVRGAGLTYPAVDFRYNLTVAYETAVSTQCTEPREKTAGFFNESTNTTETRTVVENVTVYSQEMQEATRSEIVEGSVSADAPHVHDTGIENITGYSVQVISVSRLNETLPADALEFRLEGDSVVTTTGLSTAAEGFGMGFESGESGTANVPLNEFGISAPLEAGAYELVTSLVYNGSAVSEAYSQFTVGEPFVDSDGDGYGAGEDCMDMNPSVNPGASELCDGLDNDCDGSVDDNCIEPPCTDGDSRACGNSTGECWAGSQTCQNGTWGACEGFIGPGMEACDGLDNDCDGAVDEFCISTDNTTANRPPELASTIPGITVAANTNATLDLSVYFTDPDGDALSYSALQPDGIAISVSGPVATIIPENNFTGTRSTVFTASDGINATISNTVAINVTALAAANQTAPSWKGMTRCGKCLYIRNSTGANVSIWDDSGNLDLRGTLQEGNAGTPDGSDLVFQDSAGNVVAWVDGATGNMKIAGSKATDNGSYCTPPAKSYVVRDSLGNCVSYIDPEGNLWLRGRLTESAGI